MKKLINFIVDYPKSTLVLSFGIIIFMVFGLTRLELSNNQESELPEEDPMVKNIENVKKIFGKKDVIIIGISAENIFTTQTLQKIQNITNDLKTINGVQEDEILSITSVNNITSKEWGLEIGSYIKDVPISDSVLNFLKIDMLSNNLVKGRLISDDGKFTSIVANISVGYDEKLVFDQVEAIVKKYKGSEKIYYAGDPIQQQDIDRGIKSDLAFLMPLSFLFILLGLFFSFRTARGTILPFIVVLVTIIFTMGFMGLVGLPITVVSSLTPILMVAIACSYGIHLVHRYYEELVELPQKEAIIKAFSNTWSAIVMTGLTSAIGMATLLFFRVKSIRQFGLIGSVGMLCAVLITLIIIPAILALIKEKKVYKKTETSIKHEKFMVGLGQYSMRNKYRIVFVSIIVLFISIVGTSKIKVGNDFSQYFPEKHRLRETFNKFNEKLGGARALNVVIKGNSVDAVKDPEFLKQIGQLQEYSLTLKGVGSSLSIVDIISRMHNEINKYDTSKLPLSSELAAQYLLLYSMSGNPAEFNDMVDANYQTIKIRFMLTSSEQNDHMNIYSNLIKYTETHFSKDTELYFSGDVMFWLAQIKYIVEGKIQNIVSAIFLVFLICILFFRSFRFGFFSIIPVTFSSLITFGLMGFIGIRLDIATAIITSVSIGIGIDFAIHFLLRFKNDFERIGNHTMAVDNTMKSTGLAVIYDTASNVFAFSAFLFSAFMPVRYFGWLISFTMITMAFSTLILLPVLIAIFNPKIKLIK